jgi:hypothetical protein
MCRLASFELPHYGHTLKDRPIDRNANFSFKKCNSCLYVTFTDKRNCPCCHIQFSMRKRKGHEKGKQNNLLIDTLTN